MFNSKKRKKKTFYDVSIAYLGKNMKNEDLGSRATLKAKVKL